MAKSDIYVLAAGIVYTSVCSAWDDAEVEDWVNSEYPTGTNPWVVTDENFADGTPNHSQCPDLKTHRHILLSC